MLDEAEALVGRVVVYVARENVNGAADGGTGRRELRTGQKKTDWWVFHFSSKTDLSK